MSGDRGAAQACEPPLLDPTGPLVASGNLRRRMVTNRVVETASVIAAMFAVGLLAILVYDVVSKAAPALSFGFIFQNPQGLVGGGIANSLLGSMIVVGLGAAIATPIGILTGLYLTEFAGSRSRTGRLLKLGLDLMQGLPTIVVGLFVYGLLVIPAHRQTGFAGSVALAIVMLPLMARSSQEVLLLVPGSLREAADALGVARWRTVLTVILPAAAGGIVTGGILSVARAAGETAPLLVVDSLFNTETTQLNPFGHGVPSVPMFILNTFDLAVQGTFTRVWGAAAVLLLFILLANIGARAMLARSRRKLTG
jgi:phosphate transport system permease protein